MSSVRSLSWLTSSSGQPRLLDSSVTIIASIDCLYQLLMHSLGSQSSALSEQGTCGFRVIGSVSYPRWYRGGGVLGRPSLSTTIVPQQYVSLTTNSHAWFLKQWYRLCIKKKLKEKTSLGSYNVDFDNLIVPSNTFVAPRDNKYRFWEFWGESTILPYRQGCSNVSCQFSHDLRINIASVMITAVMVICTWGTISWLAHKIGPWQKDLETYKRFTVMIGDQFK